MPEHALAVVERAESDRHQDGIEWSGQFSDEGAILDIAEQKREIGMGLARLGNHALAEIDTHSVRRLESSKQFPGAASELQHSGTVPDQELEIEKVLGVKEGGAGKPFAAARCARIGKAANLLLTQR